MKASDAKSSSHAQPELTLPYLVGLDGLRALAVAAVLLYHAEFDLRGGFLGVESFFVISGYLITALLLAEWQQGNSVDILAFWLRRARRILPALFLTIAATVVLAVVLLPPEEIESLPGDALAAIGFVMNWRLIASQQSYFDPLVRPPLLKHVWSLAVEEQFYLIWPLLLALGMRVLHRRGMLLATLLAAAASTALMALLFTPDADPARVYYGTDTRASGLLIGAALAFWLPGHTSAANRQFVGRLLDLAGVMAIATLIASFALLDEFNPLLYQGGFTLVAIVTAVVIVAVAHPLAVIVPRTLGWPPLVWIGLRSYGIYLWHWPVFMVTRPYQDVQLDGLPLLALRLTIVLMLTELTYRYVEQPVRRGALQHAWRAMRRGARGVKRGVRRASPLKSHLSSHTPHFTLRKSLTLSWSERWPCHSFASKV